MADKWNWKGLAIAVGILWGLYLGLAALFAMLNVSFWWFNPEIFGILAGAYPGLAPTFAGLVLGLIWGFVCGAVCGGILAWLYNWAGSKWK